MGFVRPLWQWDEDRQVGTDYTDETEVRVYDQRMSALRDRAEENRCTIELLGVTQSDSVLEVGTGTGSFALQCARVAERVVALDVSQAMLNYAAEQAERDGIRNISFVRAGFLSYVHEGPPVDLVVSQLALHHLPDPWKLVALRRLAGIVRSGGRLLLSDVVFPDDAATDFAGYCEALVGAMPSSSATEMARHLASEFSTFDWAMRGILIRAGFSLEHARTEGAFLTHYLCRRP